MMPDSDKPLTTTAKLGAIPLVTVQSSDVCGAAFALVSKAKVDIVMSTESFELEIKQDQRDVVVRFRGAKGATEVFEKGHLLAQQGLDLASILGKLDTVIQDAEEDHVLWWTDASGLVIRLVSTVTMPVGVGPATLQVADSNGNIVPPVPVHPRHHSGFRYYRLAQSSEDLYDAYRNMYLAFEALLSERCPKLKKGQQNKKTNEGEREWLDRGLKLVETELSLGGIVPNAPDTAKAILSAIYDDARLPLFHSKKGEKVYTPHDSPSDRKIVSNALKVLTHVVLRMAEKWFDARRMGGMVMLGWLYEFYSNHLKETRMLASEDNTPFYPDDNNLEHPRYKNALHLASRLAPELQLTTEPTVIGQACETELRKLSVFNRVDLVNATSILINLKLESELTFDGITSLEVVMHMRAVNSNQPKSLFKQ